MKAEMTKEEVNLAFDTLRDYKSMPPQLVEPIRDLALRGLEAEGILSFTSSALKEATARNHRLDAQLYPLREVARIAELVWRDAVRAEVEEEHFFKVSPRFMELLSDTLAKWDKARTALASTPSPAASSKEGEMRKPLDEVYICKDEQKF